jgi:hypothetical protein
MFKILKLSTEIGRCFMHLGRIVVWCEEKRNFACMAPEELEHGKNHVKSKVFVSGISLINFLYCAYEIEKRSNTQSKKTEKISKKET